MIIVLIIPRKNLAWDFTIFAIEIERNRYANK